MTITLAQFLHSFRGKAGAKRTILAEIEYAYEAAGVINTRTIYLSDRSYRTLPTDSPANVRHRDVISMSPTFERSIDLTRLGGRGRISVGSLTLDNCDGAVDFLLETIIDGREIRFYAGEQGWARADFRLVNVAVVAAVKAPNTDELVIELADKNYLLDDTIIGDTMATGPNAGKPKPIVLGSVYNFDITPYLFDSSALKYYINNFALDTNYDLVVQAVRDAGVSLNSGTLFTYTSVTLTANAGTDTLTYAAHGLAANDVIEFENNTGSPIAPGLSFSVQYWVIAAGLTANDFRLSLTKGGAAVDITGAVAGAGNALVNRRRYYVDTAAASIELSSSPSGRVTADLVGQNAAGTLDGVPHRQFKYLLQNYTALAASEYDTTSIDALIALEVASIGTGFAILDRTNVLDLLDAIAFATYSWYAWNASGVLTVGRLDLANLDSASSIDTITTTDIEGDLACENLPLPWGKVVVDCQRNIVVQTDGLAGAVTAANRALWGQAFQTRASTTDPATATYLANWWDYHKSAIDSQPIPTANVGTAATVQAVIDAITALFGPWTRAYRCTVGVDKYALNPGDCITLTHPRFGLSAGKKVRVMAVKPRFSDGLCDLVMARKVTPDYTNATY